MTIKDVATRMNISNDTLRYYEKIGLLGTIKRDKSGNRDYDEDDLKRIEFIMCMRNVRIPIEALKEYIRLFEFGDETREQRKNILIEQKKILDKNIEEMQKASQRLEYKITLYYEGKLDEYYEKEGK